MSGIVNKNIVDLNAVVNLNKQGLLLLNYIANKHPKEKIFKGIDGGTNIVLNTGDVRDILYKDNISSNVLLYVRRGIKDLVNNNFLHKSVFAKNVYIVNEDYITLI